MSLHSFTGTTCPFYLQAFMVKSGTIDGVETSWACGFYRGDDINGNPMLQLDNMW